MVSNGCRTRVIPAKATFVLSPGLARPISIIDGDHVIFAGVQAEALTQRFSTEEGV